MNDATESLKLSQSSSFAPDPLSDVLNVLGARITRLTRLEAAGDWALSFPGLTRLKFVAQLRGQCWMMVPGQAPQQMQAGDVCLIGRTDYAVASQPLRTPASGRSRDPGLLPIRDGRPLYDGQDVARLGGQDVIGIGGSVTFDGAGADFLLDMLPDFMRVPRETAGSGAVASVLSLIADEGGRTRMGGGIIRARLADVLLVETFRACAQGPDPMGKGWLGAVLDPRIGRALQALHAEVAHPWTVGALAQIAGMSRSAFSAEFTRRIGLAPLTYLRAWRLTLARRALSAGTLPVAEVAERVGYTSQSAFAQAFRRAYGRPPRSLG